MDDQAKPTARIAMWSGPRNISTAMMRAWGNRADTFVCDEPFYAYYLRATGAKHPLAAEIVAHQESNPEAVAAWLSGAPPADKTIFYQKQMTHHLLPEVDRSWLARVTNCFLIRDPHEVLTSYLKKNYEPTAADLGFPQQLDIYDWVCAHTGQRPPIIDARDVLENPRTVLSRLCEVLSIPFDEAMLAWPPGFRETDGIWAPHWYTEVIHSTTFAPYRPKNDAIPAHLQHVYEECLECYNKLHSLRITSN
jgi:hypothetical protein